MLSEFQAEKVYIACGYTDLRRGIDGLAGLVQQQFRLELEKPILDAIMFSDASFRLGVTAI